MKDIDFDELDKAVNSLMGGVKSKSDRPEAKTLTLTTTLKDGEQPKYDKIQHAAEKIGSETLLGPTEKTAVLSGALDDQVNILSLSDKPLEPLTPEEYVAPAVAEPLVVVDSPSEQTEVVSKVAPSKASSGRFMDVMHPSSDMKTAQVKAQRTAPLSPVTALPQSQQPSIVVPSRPLVQPELQPETSPERSHTTPRVETPLPVPDPTTLDPVVVEVSVPVEVTLETADHVQEDDAPQVLEEPLTHAIEPFTQTPEAESASQVASEVIEQIEPLSSPFLPDAKVEKRPLGGAVDMSFADELDIASLDSPYAIDNSTDTQLSPTEANQSILPDELHNDLLAIETNLADDAEDQPKFETGEVPSVPVTGVAETTQVSDSPSSMDTTSDTPENGAIFDTTEYHKTVSHPAKRASEWVWIAVIVAIILVCAAGGAAFYLLGSQ